MRMVTVSPKTWNVIVTGIYIPPFGRGQTARLRQEPWVLRPSLSYQTSSILSIPAAPPLAPLSGELSAQQTERLPQICHNLSVSAPPSHLPEKGRLFYAPVRFFSPLQTPFSRDTIGAKGAIG